MNKKKQTVSSEKGKYRDKCGDCFYNGKCTILLKECIFKSKSSIFLK